MDIIVVASSFPREPGDPAGGFVLDASRAIAERGHRLLHLVPAAGEEEERETLGPGIEVRRLPFARSRVLRDLVHGDGIGANVRRNPLRLFGLPLLLRALRAGVEAAVLERPGAALLVHWAAPAGWALVGRPRGSEGRRVLVLHGGDVHLLRRLPLRRLFRRVLASFDTALFVSEELRGLATRALGGRLPIESAVRPMGVRLADFRTSEGREIVRARLGIDAATRVVLFVGRLIPLKGADLLARALEGLEAVCLVVAGDGPECAAIEAICRRGGVEHRLLGRRPRSEIPGLMAAADLLCVPSRLGPGGRSEGSPVVAVEAFAAGRPVVASRSGGLPELLDGESRGLLFAPGDLADLRRALRRLLDEPGLRERLARAAALAAGGYDAAVTAEVLLAALSGPGNQEKRN